MHSLASYKGRWNAQKGSPAFSFYGIKGDSILLKTSHIIDVFYFTLRIFFIFGAKNGTEMAPIGTEKDENRK